MRSWRVWLIFAAALAAAAAGWRTAPPADLGTRGGSSLRGIAALSSAALVAVPSLPVLLLPSRRRRAGWAVLAAAALGAGLIMSLTAERVLRRCTAAYAGRTIAVGTEYTPLARQYLAAHPDETRDDLVDAAAGDAETVWTGESVARCRTELAWTYFLPLPLFVLCLMAAAQAAPGGPWTAGVPGARDRKGRDVAGPAPQYDVFLSYRHEEPDRTIARELLAMLEADGFRVAIDERDFRVNESFLGEMERCVRESRYTVAIVSSRYLQSGNCQEEAVICKILDLGERRRRLIPLVVEPVDTPVWLHGIVGIDATREDPLVEPFERLTRALR